MASKIFADILLSVTYDMIEQIASNTIRQQIKEKEKK